MKRLLALLTALVLLCSLLTASAAQAQTEADAAATAEEGYSDVPEDHWAYSVIEEARQYGLMQGFAGAFGLGDSLTRASFAAILCRMFSWEAVTPEAPSYIDVLPEYWGYSYVETALSNGALEGTVSYRPEDPISREEMAVMLVRALGYEQLAQAGYDFQLPFSDVTENQGYIALAWQIGMTTGTWEKGELQFQPSTAATREQAAAMVVRVYERCVSGIEWLHGFYAFQSYGQLGLTAGMDGVSLGWARLEAGEDGVPWVNTTSRNENHWTIPTDPDAALDYLEEHQVPYNLNIFCDDAAILADEASRAAAAEAVAAMAGDYAGITMDYEALRAESKDSFTAFMTALRAALPEDKTLYVCVCPAVPDDVYFDGYDFRALGELCDKVILMAHDYQYTSVPASYLGTARTNSPLTPFNKIYYALAAMTDSDTGVADRSKIALAISFGSVGWKVDEPGRLLEQNSYHPAPSTIITRLRQPDTEMGWSELDRNPYIYYTTEDGSRYRLWYEDSRSVLDKLQLARMFGITGVSLWRLGTVPDYQDEGLYYDVWDRLLELRGADGLAQEGGV